MNWWRWLTCPHDHIRCVHGDEIIARGWKRLACEDCGRSLPGHPLCLLDGNTHRLNRKDNTDG